MKISMPAITHNHPQIAASSHNKLNVSSKIPTISAPKRLSVGGTGRKIHIKA